jgi:hypothetical protein
MVRKILNMDFTAVASLCHKPSLRLLTVGLLLTFLLLLQAFVQRHCLLVVHEQVLAQVVAAQELLLANRTHEIAIVYGMELIRSQKAIQSQF